MKTLNNLRQERRVIERRCHSDRRSTLRWHPDGGDRRYGAGRRKDDKWDTLKAVLTRLFQVQATDRMSEVRAMHDSMDGGVRTASGTAVEEQLPNDLGWSGRGSKND